MEERIEFEPIWNRKFDHYGFTTAAAQFAAEEFLEKTNQHFFQWVSKKNKKSDLVSLWQEYQHEMG